MVIVSLPPLLHQYLCLLRVSARLIGGGSGSGVEGVKKDSQQTSAVNEIKEKN